MVDLFKGARVCATRTPGVLDCHRYDLGNGDINWQLQVFPGGQVLANITESDNHNNRADAHAIAWFWNHAPDLIAELRAARETIAKLKRTIDALEAEIDQYAE